MVGALRCCAGAGGVPAAALGRARRHVRHRRSGGERHPVARDRGTEPRLMMSTLIDAGTWFVLGYFVLLNASYFALNWLAIASLYRNSQERLLEELPQAYSGLEP